MAKKTAKKTTKKAAKKTAKKKAAKKTAPKKEKEKPFWKQLQEQKKAEAEAAKAKAAEPSAPIEAPPAPAPPIEPPAPKNLGGRPKSGRSDTDIYTTAAERGLAAKNAQSAAARELFGRLPPVADPARRAAASESLELFCATYLPRIFKRPFSSMQRKIAAAIEDSICNGGKQAIAVYRRGRKNEHKPRGSLVGFVVQKCEVRHFLGRNR